MDKRRFLAATALTAGAAPGLAFAAAPTRGPALLTVTGAIGRGNRGPLDPVWDVMMHKQHVAFDKAYAFDWAALAALPAVTLQPTLEYDAKPHALRGPLLLDVLAQAGAKPADSASLVLRAIDGYAGIVSAAQARSQRFIVATHLDGQPMPLGGLGPLWAVCDADRVPALAAKPLGERYAGCPWALYHVEVKGSQA